MDRYSHDRTVIFDNETPIATVFIATDAPILAAALNLYWRTTDGTTPIGSTTHPVLLPPEPAEDRGWHSVFQQEFGVGDDAVSGVEE